MKHTNERAWIWQGRTALSIRTSILITILIKILAHALFVGVAFWQRQVAENSKWGAPGPKLVGCYCYSGMKEWNGQMECAIGDYVVGDEAGSIALFLRGLGFKV